MCYCVNRTGILASKGLQKEGTASTVLFSRGLNKSKWHRRPYYCMRIAILLLKHSRGKLVQSKGRGKLVSLKEL